MKKLFEVNFILPFRPGKIIFLLILVITVSACVSSVTGVILSDGTLEMKLDADPKMVFTGNTTTVYVDVENKDIKTLENVNVEVFEFGLMAPVDKNRCKTSLQQMLPNKTFSLRCEVRAPPEIIEDAAGNTIHAKAAFKANLRIIQTIDFLSEQWYERLRITGLTPKPRKYAYSDKNVRVTVEFSDSLPIVIRENRKYYMYITIENIGKGIVREIKADDISLEYTSRGAGSVTKQSCSIQSVIYSVGDRFPRIACEIALPRVETQKTEDLILGINYNYDIRSSAVVTIKK